MDQAVVGPHGGGASPHFVVQIRRRGDVGRIVLSASGVITANLNQANGAQFAGLDDIVARFDQVRSAAPLGAHLDDAVHFSRGCQHGLAFEDIHTDGFLHIDIGTGFQRGNQVERMPMIGRADQHNIEVPFLQHFPVIAVRARRLAGNLAGGHQIGRVGQHPAVNVAERHDLNRGHLEEPEQITLAVPPAADQADAFFGTRNFLGIIVEGTQGQAGCAGDFEKVAAIHFLIMRPPGSQGQGLRSPV